jgi:hypothetical protein
VFFDYTGERTRRWFRRFPYTPTVLASGLVFAVGLVLAALLVAEYVRNDLRLALGAVVSYLGVTGLLLMIAAFMTFTFTLLLHSTAVAVWRRR